MPTHAILGGTGATGSVILRCLLSSDTQGLTINVFVRSKEKLLALVPTVENSHKHRVNIFAASISDMKTLSRCLTGTSIIYLCIATNKPARITTIAVDLAQNVINALKDIQTNQGSAYTPPTAIINRSASQKSSIRMAAPS